MAVINLKTTFFKSLITSIYQTFRMCPVFFILFVVIYISSPVSLSYLNWYTQKVEGVIVSVDPHLYPRKSKQYTYYNYYAKVHFPVENLTKTVEVHELTHKNAVKGDVYNFSRHHSLQTGSRNLYYILAVFHFAIFTVSSIFIFISFLTMLNSFYSSKKI